ncbi:MAG: hypothetical protein P4M07_15780 [Xanthobacteraceae bacterium]|nr:hypothetical protein [Xanthobacteraceae bacterium]
MRFYRVQPWPGGIGSPPADVIKKVEGSDELDAAERILRMQLQVRPRANAYIRAMVLELGKGGSPTMLYAAE